MRLLLDTHVLIWALTEPERIGGAIRSLLVDPSNEVLFSAASIWEIAIKAGLGRVQFAYRPEEIFATALRTGFHELTIRSAAAQRVADLPLHHRDPFDRLLIVQAINEPAHFLTADRNLVAYSDLVTLI